MGTQTAFPNRFPEPHSPQKPLLPLLTGRLYHLLGSSVRVGLFPDPAWSRLTRTPLSSLLSAPRPRLPLVKVRGKLTSQNPQLRIRTYCV